MSTLGEALTSYLHLRRSLGFKLHDAGLELPRFIAFMQERQAEYITADLALEWAQGSPNVQPVVWARRLGFVRGFATYRSATDARTEVPMAGLLPHHTKRARPYIYSEQEVRDLLAAALELPCAWRSTPLWPGMFHCLLGLLSVTGLRISEALNLNVGDVNLEQAVLTIRGAKFGKTRLVPIHPSTCQVLTDYLRRREQYFRAAVSNYVFVSRRGNRLDGGQVRRTFYTLSRRVGLRALDASRGPRLHDFRHRFAVDVLTRWYHQGDDVQRQLPVLSTYLGHVHVADTYWYLSAYPELMSQAMSRLERRWGEAL
jgi:integrase/recombinase XerD